MKIKFKLIFCVFMLIALSGCQQLNNKRSEYVRNRANDYLKSSLITPLRVPEDLSKTRVNEIYPLPRELPQGNLQTVSLAPPGFGSLN